MSATNRGNPRIPFDDYPTPAWATHLLIKQVSSEFDSGDLWLEPAAGAGSIIRAVNDVRLVTPKWSATEIQEQYYDPLQDLWKEQKINDFTIADFLSPTITFDKKFDVVLTNPPYRLAQKFIQKSLEVSKSAVMLLRLNFLEGIQRYGWLNGNMPDIYVLPKRPQFRFGINPKTKKPFGTDACAYAWMLWRAGYHQKSGRIMLLSPP